MVLCEQVTELNDESKIIENAQIPLQGMRRTIAERMTISYQTTPHIYLTMRVDMSGFEEARSRLNALSPPGDSVHISVTALLIKATAWALADHPAGSAAAGMTGTIVLRENKNIGIAVAIKNGLIVPVVTQADRKTVHEIAKEVSV